MHEDSVWRISKHFLEETRKEHDISDPSVIGIDEFPVEKHHVYATLFYDISNSMAIYIEEGMGSDVFRKFLQKNPLFDPSGIESTSPWTCFRYIYISDAKEYFPNSAIIFYHFHVIKMINEILDRIRRKEAFVNEILKHTRYDWPKNSDDLPDRESDRLMSVKSLDLQTSHAYHSKIALQRLW